MTKPAVIVNPKHQVELTDLVENPEFRDFWNEVLKGIRKHNMNEAVLGYIHRVKQRIGTIDQINSQAALDMHRLEGSLEIWETLLYLLSEKIKPLEVEAGDTDEDGGL